LEKQLSELALAVGVSSASTIGFAQSLPAAPHRRVMTVSTTDTRGNEPSITVNFNNANQVVAAFQPAAIAFSSDGGQTRASATPTRDLSRTGEPKPAEVGPLVPPGKYAVRLKIDGPSYTQCLTVLPGGPRSPGSDADIDLSAKTGLRICDSSQFLDEGQVKHNADLLKAAENLDEKTANGRAQVRLPGACERR
jgi:hypothetical protein